MRTRLVFQAEVSLPYNCFVHYTDVPEDNTDVPEDNTDVPFSQEPEAEQSSNGMSSVSCLTDILTNV